MRLWIRRAMVLLTALGFLAGGVVRPALALAPAEPCHADHQHHQQQSAPGHADHHDHAAHQQLAGDGAHHAQEKGNPGAPSDTACFKCCGICTSAPNLSNPDVAADAVFIVFPISYLAAVLSYTDRPLVIDPGIPKRIA